MSRLAERDSRNYLKDFIAKNQLDKLHKERNETGKVGESSYEVIVCANPTCQQATIRGRQKESTHNICGRDQCMEWKKKLNN